MRVDTAQNAIEVASRLLDVFTSKIDQNLLKIRDATRDEAYDAGFKDASDALAITVAELDLMATVNAVFPGELDASVT